MDHSRYYPLNFPDRNAEGPDRGDAYYRAQIRVLYEKCHSHQSRRNSLYIGDLGTKCFLPYRLATSKTFALDLLPPQKGKCEDVVQVHIEQARWDVLAEALSFAKYVRQQQRGRSQRVSLLEGELVGALTMNIVICHAMLSLVDSLDIEESKVSSLESNMKSCQDDLLTFCYSDVMELPPSECEILYGRAGYLKSIAFVRRELSDPQFGVVEARTLVGDIFREGRRLSAQLNSPLPLIWGWHSSLYLGAAHGVTGIIHALLEFEKELRDVDLASWSVLKQTVAKLKDYCFNSGNLTSSIPNSGDFKMKTDRLVQFCHGAPGHVLLLTQMYTKSQENWIVSDDVSLHLNTAKQIAQHVILPRGLLRKGVGLCHGISGNAYCFLSIHDADTKASNEEKTKKRDIVSDDWLKFAYMYANFALDNLNELQRIPDHPYSLFEGLSGLVCFLIDLVDTQAGAEARFPCFEL
jgi:hypothetical protein